MECRNERRGKESKFAGGENPRRRAKNRRSYNGEKREIERMKPHVVMKDECKRTSSEGASGRAKGVSFHISGDKEKERKQECI